MKYIDISTIFNLGLNKPTYLVTGHHLVYLTSYKISIMDLSENLAYQIEEEHWRSTRGWKGLDLSCSWHTHGILLLIQLYDYPIFNPLYIVCIYIWLYVYIFPINNIGQFGIPSIIICLLVVYWGLSLKPCMNQPTSGNRTSEQCSIPVTSSL